MVYLTLKQFINYESNETTRNFAKTSQVVKTKKLSRVQTKLTAYGISDNLLPRISNFLVHRTQQTKVCRATSLVSLVLYKEMLLGRFYSFCLLTMSFLYYLRMYCDYNVDCDKNELQELVKISYK